MGTGKTMRSTSKTRTARRFLAGLVAGFALLAATEKPADAQEILLTGPLAGAPAVRKLRLYREGRFEIAPTFSFTLLDEYKRQIMPGIKLNYNFTDWIAVGLWGSFGLIDPLNLDTDLSKRIQRVSAQNPNGDFFVPDNRDPQRLLTRVNLSPDFTEQTGTIDFIIAPQLTLIPFRGKLALFQSIYVDTDLHFFVGPAIVALSERASCSPTTSPCFLEANAGAFDTASRITATGTFGLGFSFFVNKWNSFGFDYRITPFKRNTGGFDIAGGGPGDQFPDLAVNSKDRELIINQMISVQWSFFLPTEYRISE